MRFRVIDEHRGCWPVSIMCHVFQVSVAGYYAWRKRPDSARAAENRALLDDIRAVHDASQGRYGTLRSHSMRYAPGTLGCSAQACMRRCEHEGETPAVAALNA